MRMLRVELERFRAYPDAVLDLPETGIVVITGPNNSGKSALLSAVDVIGGQPVDGLLPFAGSVDEPLVVGCFEFSAAERKRMASHLGEPVRAEAESTYMGARLSFADVLDGRPQLGVVKIEVLASDGRMWGIAELQPGRGQATVVMVDWGTWLNSWPDKPEPNQTTSGSVHRYLEPQAAEAFNLPSWCGEWRVGFYHFKALRTGAGGRIGSAEAADQLHPTGANLANHLLWLRGHREDEWLRIRETMRELIPDVGRLQVRSRGGNSELGFDKSDGRFENIKDLGTGVEQLLMTITVGQTAAATMLLIEEPETNLHPGAQRQLMAHLRQWAVTRPIIVTSHSPVIIDGADSPLVYVVRRADGKSTVSPVGKDDREVTALLSNLGVRFSDLLGSDRVLIVEGPTDGPVLQAWFPDLFATSSVAVVAGGGGAGVWHIRLLEDVSGAADRLPRPVLYIRDRDELSARNLDRLGRLQMVQVLQKRELENYLLDAAAVATVLAMRRPEDPPPDTDHVAAALRSAAESLKQHVIVSRVLENAPCLKHITPIAMHERSGIRAAEDPISAIVDLVRPRLEVPLAGLAECLTQTLAEQKAEVEAAWEEHWINVAPGADVLASVFEPYGGFSKELDGPAIASAMSEPPEELRRLLTDFLALVDPGLTVPQRPPDPAEEK